MKRFSRPFRITVFVLTVKICASTAGYAASTLERAVELAAHGSFAQAYCLLKPLADADNAEAQYHLGWMYANGEGMRIDDAHAVRYWNRAAQNGHVEAQYRLAIAYLNGEGTRRNVGQAVKWLGYLMRNGDEDARDRLVQLFREEEPAVMTLFGKLIKEQPELLGAPLTVDVARGNVRDGPGKGHPVIFSVNEGDNLVLLEDSGNWRYVGVRKTGKFGWLHDSLVKEK